MNKGFNSLGTLLKITKMTAKAMNTLLHSCTLTMSQMNMTVGQTKNLRNLLVRYVFLRNNGDILNKPEKELNASEKDGADIHRNLATIVQKLLKDKPEEDKLNKIK